MGIRRNRRGSPTRQLLSFWFDCNLDGRITAYPKKTKVLGLREAALQCHLPLEVHRNSNRLLLQGELEGSE